MSNKEQGQKLDQEQQGLVENLFLALESLSKQKEHYEKPYKHVDNRVRLWPEENIPANRARVHDAMRSVINDAESLLSSSDEIDWINNVQMLYKNLNFISKSIKKLPMAEIIGIVENQLFDLSAFVDVLGEKSKVPGFENHLNVIKKLAQSVPVLAKEYYEHTHPNMYKEPEEIKLGDISEIALRVDLRYQNSAVKLIDEKKIDAGFDYTFPNNEIKGACKKITVSSRDFKITLIEHLRRFVETIKFWRARKFPAYRQNLFKQDASAAEATEDFTSKKEGGRAVTSGFKAKGRRQKSKLKFNTENKSMAELAGDQHGKRTDAHLEEKERASSGKKMTFDSSGENSE